MRRGALLLLLTCWLAPIASMAEPTPGDRALANELFNEGRTLMSGGKYAEACGKLEESQRLDPGGGTILNLAICHEAEGRTATAWAEFGEAISVSRRDGRAEREKIAEEHIAALESRLSRLVIVVPAEADLPGLTVMRDGSAVGRAAWGTAMPVDPGAHEIEASAPGRAAWRHSLVAVAAERRSVSVPPLVVAEVAAPAAAQPSAAPAPLAAPAHEVPPASAGSETLGYVLGGAGIAGLALGGVFGVITLEKDCRAGCRTEDAHAARTTADIASLSFAAGGLALAAGAYLILSAPSSPERSRVSVTPATTGAGASASVAVRF